MDKKTTNYILMALAGISVYFGYLQLKKQMPPGTPGGTIGDRINNITQAAPVTKEYARADII